MATITAAEVNKLRRQTGAGMMDCRKALIESDGDFEKAIEYLRKKGQKVAAMRSGRETKEGVVIAKTSDDHKKGVIISLSCETDFVAKNSDFVNFAQAVADIALNENMETIDALQLAQLDGAPVSEKITDLIGKIGEKISLSSYEKLEAPYVVSYVHGNYQMGVLVSFSKPLAEEAAKDIAMQVAAMNPIAIDQESISEDVIAREKEIAVSQVLAEGKPAEMAEKIAQGKLNKFFKEQTLLSQAYIKENKQTVADFLKSADPEVKVNGFKRITLG